MIWVRVGEDPQDDRVPRELMISELGGTEGRLLAGPNEYGELLNRVQPSFSPDGSWILFGRGNHPDDGDATCTLWVVRPDGSEGACSRRFPFSWRMPTGTPRAG